MDWLVLVLGIIAVSTAVGEKAARPDGWIVLHQLASVDRLTGKAYFDQVEMKKLQVEKCSLKNVNGKKVAVVVTEFQDIFKKRERVTTPFALKEALYVTASGMKVY